MSIIVYIILLVDYLEKGRGFVSPPHAGSPTVNRIRNIEACPFAFQIQRCVLRGTSNAEQPQQSDMFAIQSATGRTRYDLFVCSHGGRRVRRSTDTRSATASQHHHPRSYASTEQRRRSDLVTFTLANATFYLLYHLFVAIKLTKKCLNKHTATAPKPNASGQLCWHTQCNTNGTHSDRLVVVADQSKLWFNTPQVTWQCNVVCLFGGTCATTVGQRTTYAQYLQYLCIPV